VAGSSTRFNAAGFRTAIRSVMEMGAPPKVEDRLTFHFDRTTAISGSTDSEGVPFDPAASMEVTTKPDLRVPCAVEYVNATDEPTRFGVVVPTRLKVTLLDEDYARVKDASSVTMGGDRYLRHAEPPAVGLFNVGVHEMVFVAENET